MITLVVSHAQNINPILILDINCVKYAWKIKHLTYKPIIVKIQQVKQYGENQMDN